MTKPPEKSKPVRKLRCAVYTRKSSEEGLEQEFNSLHAQRCAHHGDPTTDSMNIRPAIPRTSDQPLQQHPTGMI